MFFLPSQQKVQAPILALGPVDTQGQVDTQGFRNLGTVTFFLWIQK